MLYQQIFMEAKIYLAGEVGVGIQAQVAGIIFVGIEDILGLKIENQNLTLNPCVPEDWKEYFLQYKYGSSIYNIKVKNINNTNEVQKFIFNNQEIKEKRIKLIDDGKINEREIII